MIKLGSKVRDSITGFKGIATGRSIWLYGCEQICITPTELNKDGGLVEAKWFDDQRVELVESVEPKVSEHSVSPTGGPRDNPTRNEAPSR